MDETIKKQFDELKAEKPDVLLLFRVGDFYETYEDDAVTASDVLGITLTKHGGMRMCGFPHHALDTYLPRLVRAGHRVAICDQLKEPPAPKPTSQTLNPTNEMERTIKEIGLDEIRPSAMNPRKTFDEEGIHELADNIRQHGLLQPITIRPVDGETPYEIVCGERRYRAFLLNQKIRVKQPSTIPCIVRDMSDEDALDAMITENLQRVDVDPMEEAFAFAQLVGMGKTVDEIALRFGKSKRFIADRIRLDKLIPELKAGVTSGGVNIGAALLLCKLDEDTQRDFLDDWEPDPDDPITKDNVNMFTDRLFMNITCAPWSEEFQGSCKCTCGKCEFNNSNAGCLFYEMKINRDDACCTNRDRFETKRMDWLKHIIDKNANVLVKAGDQLETGKTVVATINLYGREDKEFNELIEYAKGQGYECVKCSDVFNRWSSYRESDERLKEKLANNEVYRVLLIEQEYNGVSVRIAYFDFQKKASAEDKTGAEAMQLVAQYKDNISKSRSSIAKEMRNAIKEFDTKGISSEMLTENEWKAFIALLIHKSPYFVREAIMGNERDEVAFVESKNLPEQYDTIIRDFMKGLVSDSSVEYYYTLQACQALLIDAWGIDATDVRAKVAEKLAKKQHKIEERLTALGYDTDGKKLDF